MIHTTPGSIKTLAARVLAAMLAVIQVLFPVGNQAWAAVDIASLPLEATVGVPTNLMLTLSVEFPTGVVAAYNDDLNTDPGFECPGRDTGPDDLSTALPKWGVGVCYFDNRTYLGYFDPKLCYSYSAAAERFEPAAAGQGANQHQCDGTKWSGNFLNWATMHAIDEFRWALTGGDRVVDTTTETVLEKARHTGQGANRLFPVKRIGPQFGAVPALAPSVVSPKKNWGSLFVRVTGPGNPDPLSKPGVLNSEGRVMQIADNAAFINAETYLVRVKVCDPAFPESQTTCTAYGASLLKPTGLIQRNAERLRFGVTSYLNDSDKLRPGGVIRSRMKFVGPENTVPLSTPTTNPNREWAPNTGALDPNPNGADASASGVSQSGVINYLNKFGKANGYKEYDTLSEMFYEATRYMRNLPPTLAYTDTPGPVTDAMKDGFPVITNWTALDENDINNRPIQYSCQKTFFLGIADSNAWCDSKVAGSSLNGCGHGTLPAEANLDATAQTNQVGALEGLGNLGTVFAPGSRENTFYLAGLGYWANTNDILPDVGGKPWTTGRQTAKSFWVDVRETGSAPGKNQMWLAAKYGGFDDRNNDGVPADEASWRTNTDTVPDGTGGSLPRPDNYFTGDRPDRLVESFKEIFQSLNDQTLSGAGAAVSAQTLDAGGSTYEVQYFTKDWSGDVLGNQLTFDDAGVPTETNIWSAKQRLNAQAAGAGWDTGRRVVSSNGSISTPNSGVPFRWGSLTTAQQGFLAKDPDLLDYVRGSRTNERIKFRARGGILGDIVNSDAIFVGAPIESYLDASNPGFSAFKSANVDRSPIVYVGSNDGMLHAFNADTTSGTTLGGTELFAYVPSFVLPGPNGTPAQDGLRARASLNNFDHQFYVDGTPVARSVDFARTCAAPLTGCTFDTALASQWRTILVGGLRKGGKGYYALDVTDPGSFNTEASAAGKVLWEFTDADMGLTFGRPVIAKTAKYGWVVILPSGYNNTTGPNPGKGFLYILNAQTGALLEKIGPFGPGDATNPSGFAHIAGFTPNFGDFTVTEVYGGDLAGDLWRFDLKAASGSYPAPVQAALLENPIGTGQPITTEPRIEIDIKGVVRWVFLGTGKLLGLSDLLANAATDQTQSFYAFRDGSVTAPLSTGLPLTRTQLVELTDPLLGITVPLDKNGWFIDLANTATTPAQRVVNEPTANEGVIAWIGQVPTTDPCRPGPVSTVFAVEYATGRSRLTNYAGVPVANFTTTSTALRVMFVKVGGRVRAVLSTERGALERLPGQFGYGGSNPVRLNWREILN
jgi:type IV pilus assembly protein PilY1